MKLLAALRQIELRAVLAAVIAVAILHICATLAAPHLAIATAHNRLTALLPVNGMKVLPPVTRSTQPLPFLGPDARYAMCRFDTSRSPVALYAVLPDVGWTLAIYTPTGANIYASTGQPGQPTNATIKLVPSGELFTGLTPESRGIAPAAQQPLSFAVRSGIAVVRAPERGEAYRATTETALAQASCAPLER
jgi:uncharacterized membrane protein